MPQVALTKRPHFSGAKPHAVSLPSHARVCCEARRSEAASPASAGRIASGWYVLFAMATRPTEDDLDLPALDGEEDEAEEAHEELEVQDDAGDAFDDATAGEAVNVDDVLAHVHEEARAGGSGLLEGSEESAVDVGPFDLSLGGGDASMLGEEEPDGRDADDELAADESSVSVDGGEEGPLAEDEELREEDLPALDADEAGDVDDAELYDRSILGVEEELRWDDRAWARVELPNDYADDGEDSGMLATPAEENASPRDIKWKALEEAGRVTASALVPGGSVVVAVDAEEHPWLVRIDAEGAARIIAQIERVGEDDGDACRVTSLRWDPSRGAVVASGNFGVQAFAPA